MRRYNKWVNAPTTVIETATINAPPTTQFLKHTLPTVAEENSGYKTQTPKNNFSDKKSDK